MILQEKFPARENFVGETSPGRDWQLDPCVTAWPSEDSANTGRPLSVSRIASNCLRSNWKETGTCFYFFSLFASFSPLENKGRNSP